MSLDQYILVDRVPVRCSGLAWGEFMERIDSRRVAETNVGGKWVSTVFLGIDHQWGHGPPLLFETMVFRGKDEIVDDDDIQERCSTWEEAEAQHARMVEMIKGRAKGTAK